jgi:glutamate-1-semialdehyde aminotransferase
MLGRGVWLPPSQFEAMFMNAGILFSEVDDLLEKAEEAMKSL